MVLATGGCLTYSLSASPPSPLSSSQPTAFERTKDLGTLGWSSECVPEVVDLEILKQSKSKAIKLGLFSK